MSFELPVATEWDHQNDEKRERLLDELNRMVVRPDGTMSTTGALVLETVQRIDSSASYGQLSFVAAPQTRGKPTPEPVRADVQFALHMPHITFQVAGRGLRTPSTC